MEANASFKRIDVERKKTRFATGVGKVIGLTIGNIGILISWLLFLSIVGIFIAIPLFIISLGIIFASIGWQTISCPHCGLRQFVRRNRENFKCRKCRQLTIIDWIEPSA